MKQKKIQTNKQTNHNVYIIKLNNGDEMKKFHTTTTRKTTTATVIREQWNKIKSTSSQSAIYAIW